MKAVKAVAVYKIKISGKVIAAGDEFDCEDKGLLAIGAAVPASDFDADGDVEKVPAGDDGTGGNTEADDQVEAITALLIDWLKSDPNQEDETKWTKDKSPRNKAVDSALGFDVSNDDIAPIWAEIVAAGSGE